MKNAVNYLALIAIGLWLAWMNYEARHPTPSVDVSFYQERIDSMQNELSHLEARRDTIIERVVSVQVKWREKLVEVRKTSPNDSIKVPITTPLELDSCMEVGIALMKRIEATDEIVYLYSQKNEIMSRQVGVLSNEIQNKNKELEKNKNRARMGHTAAVLVGIGLVILAL
jgi:hypothetical protein